MQNAPGKASIPPWFARVLRLAGRQITSQILSAILTGKQYKNQSIKNSRIWPAMQRFCAKWGKGLTQKKLGVKLILGNKNTRGSRKVIK
jgi:hypothetical protein